MAAYSWPIAQHQGELGLLNTQGRLEQGGGQFTLLEPDIWPGTVTHATLLLPGIVLFAVAN